MAFGDAAAILKAVVLANPKAGPSRRLLIADAKRDFEAETVIALSQESGLETRKTAESVAGQISAFKQLGREGEARDLARASTGLWHRSAKRIKKVLSLHWSMDEHLSLAGAAGATDICTMGNSAAGPTNLSETFMAEDGRGSSILRRIYEVSRPEELDLRTVIETSIPVPRVQVRFGGANVKDAQQARNLTGVAGVELLEEAGVREHAVLLHIAADGRFMDMMCDLLQLHAE